jgi:PRC-barrel domain
MISDPQTALGRSVIGPDGEKIGKVEEIYLDTDSQQPQWMSVTTGFFGSHRSLARFPTPSTSATILGFLMARSRSKRLPTTIQIANSLKKRRRTSTGYGMSTEAPGAEAGEPGVQGRDVSGPTTDQAMTRSEEQLRVGTQRRDRPPRGGRRSADSACGDPALVAL